MNENEKYELANNVKFLIAIENAQNYKPVLQTQPFMTIGDRARLISELEQQGFKIVESNRVVSRYDTNVILIPANISQRKALENIELMEYESEEDLIKDIISENLELGSKIVKNDIKIYPLTDFMDIFNNADPEDLDAIVNIDTQFFGYVKIKRPKR